MCMDGHELNVGISNILCGINSIVSSPEGGASAPQAPPCIRPWYIDVRIVMILADHSCKMVQSDDRDVCTCTSQQDLRIPYSRTLRRALNMEKGLSDLVIGMHTCTIMDIWQSLPNTPNC